MDAELKRVKKNLRQHVVDFFAQRMAGKREFTNDDLEDYCREAFRQQGGRCTAGSPGRVMRDLCKKEKVLRYTLLSKRASKYRADFVAAEQLELFAA